MKAWSGRAVSQARQYVATRMLPGPCGQCGKTVEPDPAGTPAGKSGWVVGHIKARATHPELTWEPSNWRPEHRRCSNRSAQAVVIEKARADALRDASHATRDAQRDTTDPTEPVSSRGSTPGQPPPLPSLSLDGLAGLLDGRGDPMAACEAHEWLRGFLAVPDDAAVPLAMSGPHPRAVGSYGPEAIEWAKRELGVTLRWWQQLSLVRRLEHDADGALVWRQVVESAPRRSGKSVGMRVTAQWRIGHADLLGEVQEVMLTSKDLQVAREIMRPAWAWVLGGRGEGWDCRRANGGEEVEAPDGSRWLVRAGDATYGYSPGLGMADEAWGIKPGIITDGLEPALLERCSPQLMLTSTAHPKASSLMRTRLLAALRDDDPNVLLLWWGAHPDADPGDPGTWKAASPHWTEDRRIMLESKYLAAVAGEADPEFDDMTPMESFTSQYLNRWPLLTAKPAPGDALTTADEWAELAAPVPAGPPAAAAVEASYDAVSVALAYRDGDQVVVTVTDVPDLTAAAAAVGASGFRRRTIVGASLVEDPALRPLRPVAGKGRAVAAVGELARLIADGGFRHDGGEHLAGQVTAVRTMPAADGPRLVSRERTDAVKAAVWAATEARKVAARQPGRPVFVTARR